MIPPNQKWDDRFLALAHHISSWSKDPTTRVGAVIVNPRRVVVSMGYNGFPRGVEDSPERLKVRHVKHAYTAHADQNALDQAWCDVSGCTIYCTMAPCARCANSIIQRGIVRVVTITPTHEPWMEEFLLSRKKFSEAGVFITLF